jgi:hypothetical protein
MRKFGVTNRTQVAVVFANGQPARSKKRLEARRGGISLPINVCVMDITSARTEKWY